MKKPAFLQPRILKQAIKAVFLPAYTTGFPAEPFEPQESFRGRPRFHADGCIGCGACAQVCPPKCIEVIDDLDSKPPRHPNPCSSGCLSVSGSSVHTAHT